MRLILLERPLCVDFLSNCHGLPNKNGKLPWELDNVVVDVIKLTLLNYSNFNMSILKWLKCREGGVELPN